MTYTRFSSGESEMPWLGAVLADHEHEPLKATV
jgi:hypothetical protein